MKSKSTSTPEEIVFPVSLFAHNRSNGQYLFNREEITNKVITGKDLHIPLVIDTEFWQAKWKDYIKNTNCIEIVHRGELKKLFLDNYWKHGRYGVTTQCKGIYENEGIILAHPDLENIAKQLGESIRHPIADSGFHPIDYLKQLGIEAKINRSIRDDGKPIIQKEFKGERIPVCEFILYAHFALAEWGMIATGDYRKDLIRIAQNNKNERLEMQRRVRTVTEGKYGQSDSIDLPWRIRINGLMYRVRICLIDTFAIHGVASYKDFCESAEIKLNSKEKMDNYKSTMHLAYFELPQDFDDYALGDLEVYNALSKNAENFKKIWKTQGIEEYYKPPKLTIGATVRDIFEAKIYKLFNIKFDDKKAQDELLDKVCKFGTAEYLKQFTTSTQCLNAKVEGGRCRNNRPSLVSLKGTLIDIDYSGCYGEGQRNQIYPFGRPVVDEFDYPSKLNRYPSLREWLNARKWGKKNCELIPGLWQARVSTKEIWKGNEKSYDTLKIPQDYLASWFDFNLDDIGEMKTDSEIIDVPEDEVLEVRTGQTKIFNYQIINGLISHDFIDWLYNVCSPQQRNELLDNLYIHTAMYYPSYDRTDSPESLLKTINNHKGKNTTKTGKRKGGSRKTKITEENTAWYGVNLGEFIIDDLLAWRKMYPKKNPDDSKNAMNTLYKLCINTLYGDMVSPFFRISNVVVGNNITARARAACWYAEKGFYGCQSITDGTAFDINNVIYPANNQRRVTAQSVTNLHREKDITKKNLRIAALGGYDHIKLSWKEVIIENKSKMLPVLELCNKDIVEKLEPQLINNEWINPAHQWIDKSAMKHLQNLFNVDVLQADSTKLKISRGEDGTPIKKLIPRKGQFEFEAKSFYNEGFFHGSANYYLKGDGGNNIAMRSYEKKTGHESVELDEEENFILTKYFSKVTPAEFFLFSLSNPNHIPRSKVFIKEGILKLNDARKNKEKWNLAGRIAGDTIQKSGLLREFSLSQFTFTSLEQLKSISKELESNKRKYFQSYEGYFINEDGTLNFKLMVQAIDENIGNNEFKLNEVFDKSRHRHRNSDIYHPEQKALELVREPLSDDLDIESIRDWFNNDSPIQSDDEGIVYIPDDYNYTSDGYYVGESITLSEEDIGLLDELEL